MKQILFSLINMFIFLSMQAQTMRYLEKKGYEQEEKSNLIMVMPTVSHDNSRLAVAATRTETKGSKIKISYASKLLNLQQGRLELNQNGFSYYYFKDKLFVQDLTKLDGEWGGVFDHQNKVMKTPSYFFDPENNQKITPPKLPNGFTFSDVKFGKFWLLSASDYKSVALAEEVGGQYLIKNKFDFTLGKISRDSSEIYGIDGNTIKVYDIHSGKLKQAIKLKDKSYDVDMVGHGKFLYTAMDVRFDKNDQVISHVGKIIDGTGKVLLEIKDIGIVRAISDNQKELVSVKFDGLIKLIDLTTGQILAETKDTFIKKGSGDIYSSMKNGSKTVGLRLHKINGGEYYLIPYSTGIMSLFSAKERKVVANIFTDMEDWAVIASDGRMDGTTGAFDKLEWRDYDGENLVSTFSLGSTFDRYYTPRLLYTILSGDNATEASIPSINISKVPTLLADKINNDSFRMESDMALYSSSNKNVTVDIKIATNNNRITEVRLYQNGKLTGVQKGNGSDKYQFRVSLNTVFGEKNFLYAIASTADGIDSEKCKMMVHYSGSENIKPKLHVLVVGVNRYLNPKYQLNYALPDAAAIKKQLEGSKSALFQSIEVKSLFEEQVTKDGITKAFKELSAIVKEQDIFLFYYAGHGTMSDGAAYQEFYIVPHDVTQLYGNDALLNEKAISATELKKLSLSLNAQKQIFIIDACHSAGALTSVATRGAAEERAIGQLARSTGTFWLTAAGSDQFATEFEQLSHGVFTYSLLEVLQGKDQGIIADRTITIRELSSYVEQRVPELSQKYKGKPQYPASFSFGNDFPLIILD